VGLGDALVESTSTCLLRAKLISLGEVGKVKGISAKFGMEKFPACVPAFSRQNQASLRIITLNHFVNVNSSREMTGTNVKGESPPDPNSNRGH
jgi:hypothetical protein